MTQPERSAAAMAGAGNQLIIDTVAWNPGSMAAHRHDPACLASTTGRARVRPTTEPRGTALTQSPSLSRR
jgi:hypothetical protein